MFRKAEHEVWFRSFSRRLRFLDKQQIPSPSLLMPVLWYVGPPEPRGPTILEPALVCISNNATKVWLWIWTVNYGVDIILAELLHITYTCMPTGFHFNLILWNLFMYMGNYMHPSSFWWELMSSSGGWPRIYWIWAELRQTHYPACQSLRAIKTLQSGR